MFAKKIFFILILLFSFSNFCYAENSNEKLTLVEEANCYILNSSVKKVSVPYANHTNCLWLEMQTYRPAFRPGYILVSMLVADVDHNIFKSIGFGEIDYNGVPASGSSGFRLNNGNSFSELEKASFIKNKNHLKSTFATAKNIYLNKK